jgi:hypothetical protein
MRRVSWRIQLRVERNRLLAVALACCARAYFSAVAGRLSLAVNRSSLWTTRLQESPAGQRRTTNDRRPTFHFGISRCTTFTLYPALCMRFPTSSAIITERCWPPVQPKLIVK